MNAGLSAAHITLMRAWARQGLCLLPAWNLSRYETWLAYKAHMRVRREHVCGFWMGSGGAASPADSCVVGQDRAGKSAGTERMMAGNGDVACDNMGVREFEERWKRAEQAAAERRAAWIAGYWRRVGERQAGRGCTDRVYAGIRGESRQAESSEDEESR